ncbi:MAG: PAS domain S-box protein [Rhodospirillales bacterium]|nr:PAS domain S-box protein [Rhodospirillales bacterium]
MDLKLLFAGPKKFSDGPLVDGLRNGGFQPTVERVGTKTALRRALKEGSWDAVICDFDFGALNGPEAFAVFQELELDHPFIFVADKFDSETATEFMAAGAHDFIHRDNLARLTPALMRELRTSRQTPAGIASARQLFDAIQNVPMAIALFDAEDRLVFWNEQYASDLVKTGKLYSGITFEEILRAVMKIGGFPEAVGHEEEWIRARLDQRKNRTGQIESHFGNRWFGIDEHETPDGGTIVFYRDITKRKDAEDALRESEARLRGILDNSPSSILMKGADGRYETVNAAFEKQFDLKPGEAIGLKTADLFSDSFSDNIAEIDRRVLNGEAVSEILVTSSDEDPSGESRAYLSNRFPIKGIDGQVRGIGVVNTDISQQKRAEAEIRKAYDELERRVAERTRELRDEIMDRRKIEAELTKNEAWLRAIIENSPSEISLKDTNGTLLVVNKAWERQFGGLIEDWQGKDVFGVFSEEFATELADYDRRVMESMKPVEYETDRIVRNGLQGTNLTVKFPVFDSGGAVTGVGTVSTNITERKRAEEALRWSERDLRGILDNMIDTFFRTDRDGRIIMISPSVIDLLGITPEESLGRNLSEFLADPETTGGLADILDIGDDEDELVGVEWLFRKAGGENVWALTTARRYFDQDGNVAGIEGVAHDITLRKESELTLRKLSAAVEQSPVSLLITDPDGRAEYVNPRYLSFTGYGLAEVIGAVPEFLTTDDAQPEKTGDVWKRIRSGHDWRGEINGQKKDGDPYWASLAISPITNSAGETTNYLCVVTDTTEKRQLDEQLRQAQKLEAVGTLAGGIAHDFNNLLTGVMGHCYIAVEKLEAEDEVQFNLEQIKTASERARDLVAQLLAFSRRRESELRPVSLHTMVDETKKLVQAAIPATIAINWNVAEDAGTVMVDPTQVHQVLLNVCSNAADAIGEAQGTIDVSVENIVTSRSIAAAGVALAPGAYARLRITDTGCGMDAYTRDRAFDPFFTTKPVGAGTGLGLSAVHGIVEEHGGGIQLKSTIGKGTTISVYLPSVGDGKIHDDNVVRNGFGGTERVLLVDDERMVLQSIGPYLEHFGYEVEALTSGMAALAVFKSMPDHFDIVVTDQIMPGITGDVLAHELREIRPDIPIVLCTGYRPPGTEKALAKLGIDEIVQKPVEPSKIAHIIRQAIDARKPSA